jgi:hypothetical protein
LAGLAMPEMMSPRPKIKPASSETKAATMIPQSPSR